MLSAVTVRSPWHARQDASRSGGQILFERLSGRGAGQEARRKHGEQHAKPE